jgi:hypothetical protein
MVRKRKKNCTSQISQSLLVLLLLLLLLLLLFFICSWGSSSSGGAHFACLIAPVVGVVFLLLSWDEMLPCLSRLMIRT